jgi:hypothetical protein
LWSRVAKIALALFIVYAVVGGLIGFWAGYVI